MKSGYCTVLFYAFLADKMATMTMKGGNTESLYKLGKQKDGRLEMARSLMKQHPDVVTVVKKWDRWQHKVDYSRFRYNKPILKKNIKIENKINNYGMQLIKK